jgi:peptide chain release factor 2
VFSGGIFDVDERRIKIEEEEKHTYDPSFWDDTKRAEAIQKSITSNKKWVDLYDNLMTEWADLEVMKAFTDEGEFSVEDLDHSYEELLAKIEDQELLSTLSAEEDRLGCILKINSGAGGTEACDWAEMLMRMYIMWAELKQHKIRKLDQVDGDVAGIKSVILEIDGDMAYGWLKMENGVHRLVRPSPYNAQGKRQTSFASVFVYPLVDDTIQIEVNPADLDWDVFRASGAGGQHVNRTESAVRLRHLPSGIVVACQEDRSQIKNREKAIQMLKSELYKMEIERRNAARALVEAGKQKIEWGSQIRSYVLDDRRIKDHRSGHTVFDTKRILDGDIDDFLKASLMADADALQEDFD